MRTIASITLVAVGFVAVGCSFIARGTDQYRADTRDVLEKKNGAVKSCYDQALASNASLSGKVTVNFTVEKKTGLLKDVQADPDKSTAPESLQQCVVNAIDGLQLAPEDQRDGQATFTYVFQANATEGKPPAA